MSEPHKNLPSDGWHSIVESAKDAYWMARRNGRDENGALLAALDVAVAVATGEWS